METTCYDVDYTLPDGTHVKLGRERFEAAEVLFNPRLIGMELDGMAELVFNAIKVNNLILIK